jgi:hypothetical protein
MHRLVLRAWVAVWGILEGMAWDILAAMAWGIQAGMGWIIQVDSMEHLAEWVLVEEVVLRARREE